MASVDHDKLDAKHRVRMEASVELARFNRRVVDAAYTKVDTEIQRRLVNGEPIDGGEIGREAAQEVLRGYGVLDPQPAIEAKSSRSE